VYEILEAMYDPNTQFNLIGIPFLAAYFNDTNCSAGDDVDADGITIKSSGCVPNSFGITAGTCGISHMGNPHCPN
jgi:hypothetical protein